jgi:hypothetical protein
MVLYVLYEHKTLTGGFGQCVGVSNIIGEYRNLDELKNAVNEQIKLSPNGYFSVSDVYNKKVIYDTAFGWKDESKA